MTTSQLRSRYLAKSQLTLDESVRAEIEELRANGELGDGTRTEPRCHVCCEVESKELVNKLIAAGLTTREITDSCGAINMRRRDAGDRRVIGARNVWWHSKQHFNVDKPAQAAIREILERRAEERNRDHINGVGHAITSYAVIETAMVRGYQHMTEEGSDPPNIKETLDAAVKLHELTSADAGTKKMADLLFTMDRIISAARTFVPVDKQEEFLAMVEGQKFTPLDRVAATLQGTAQAAIREFTPDIKMDPDDEI